MLDKLRVDHLGDYAPKIPVPKKGDRTVKKPEVGFKAHTLLLLHLNGVKLPARYAEEAEILLKMTPRVIDILVQISL